MKVPSEKERLGNPIKSIKVLGRKIILWEKLGVLNKKDWSYVLTTSEPYKRLANALLVHVNNNTLKILLFNTELGFKRQNLGKLLEKVIYNKAVEQGYKKIIVLPVRETGADVFYKKLGFKYKFKMPFLSKGYMIKNVGKEKIKLPKVRLQKRKKLRTKKDKDIKVWLL